MELNREAREKIVRITGVDMTQKELPETAPQQEGVEAKIHNHLQQIRILAETDTALALQRLDRLENQIKIE